MEVEEQSHNIIEKCRNIPDLQNEIIRLEKDLSNLQVKSRTLQDDIALPMNIHRWNVLQKTNPDVFEKIKKVQSLSKKLVVKSAEVLEKENLIREKEKL